MNLFDLPIHQNPLRTRDDVSRALLQMVEPVLPFFTEGKTGLSLGYFAAHYGTNSARMEAYSRLLWGMAPYWVHERKDEYFPMFRAGLVNGTNPDHPEYWGDTFDYDQKIVEMAAIALFLMFHHEALAFSEKEAADVHRWLGSINGKDIPPNNWYFFRILVNTTFQLLGWDYDAAQMEQDFLLLEECYVGNGWYTDGKTEKTDYYIPFAMHYYGLIYAVAMKERDPERSALYRERAAKFAPDFLYWFTDEGQAMPFGRSLTYRFAQSSFFSALAFAEVECIPWGVMKSRVLGNLRDWCSRPIFSSDGLLTVGYSYPNLCVSENYNAPGSPYWSFKVFLCLALPEGHPFWQAEEQIPTLEPLHPIPEGRMILARNEKQVQMFVAGQQAFELGQCQPKYEKLVYSTAFGFCVGRGHSLEEGGFDSCLAVSEAGENFYRMERGWHDYALTEQGFTRRFSPMRGVEIAVEVTIDFPRHQRVYTITTDRPIDIADGGFSIPAEKDGTLYDESMVTLTPNGVAARFPWGESSIICTSHNCQPVLVKAYPNLNLLHPLVRIPTIAISLPAGTHHVVTEVAGMI